jgi:hypothetical protein
MLYFATLLTPRPSQSHNDCDVCVAVQVETAVRGVRWSMSSTPARVDLVAQSLSRPNADHKWNGFFCNPAEAKQRTLCSGLNIFRELTENFDVFLDNAYVVV